MSIATESLDHLERVLRAGLAFVPRFVQAGNVAAAIEQHYACVSAIHAIQTLRTSLETVERLAKTV